MEFGDIFFFGILFRLFLFIPCFIVFVYLAKWIFQIPKIIKNQEKELDEQKKFHYTSIELLTCIAEKLGVPAEDIDVIINRNYDNEGEADVFIPEEPEK